MASSTVDILATETNYTSYNSPSTSHYNTTSIRLQQNTLYTYYSDCGLIRFEITGETLKKKLDDAQLYFYVSSIQTGWRAFVVFRGADYSGNLQNITYANWGGANNSTSNTNGGRLEIEVQRIGWNNTPLFYNDYNSERVFIYSRDGTKFTFSFGFFTQYLSEAAVMQVAALSGSQTPYLRLYVSDVTLSVSSVTPRSGWIDRKKSQTFTWGTSSGGAIGGISAFTRTGSKFEWKTTSEETIHEITQTGTSNQISVPADTFPSDQIQIRITDYFEGEDPVVGSWYTLTTVDSIPTTTILSPKSVYIDGSVPNTFSWSHNITTGTPQSKYELEYSVNDGSSWEQVSAETTSQTSVTFPPDTFPSGSMMWRVRTANQDEIFGEWSDPATVIVRAAPDPPIISPVGSEPMPTIRWQADDQQATEIRIDSVLVATLYGSGKAYTPETFLSDGEHTVSIRVQNRFGLWSEWALASFHTENLSSDTVELSAQPVENGVALLWTGPSATYWIERDGEKIAEVNGGDFVDYTAIGEHSYRVRSVLDGGYYALSNEVSAVSSVQYAVISRVDPIAFIALEKRRNAFPTHTETIESLSTFNHYSGRSLPVAEISLHKTIRHQFDFTFKVPKESYVLDALLGETVLYKDCNGACFVGVLSAIDRTTDRASDITLTIMETGG